jgi:cytochrome c
MKAALLLGMASVLAANAAAADMAHGKNLFEECAACHALESGKQGLGPSLSGLMGRKAGSLEDFRYSPAMKRSGITWTRETLGSFLEEPQRDIAGNRMPYSGMPERKDREDLLEYLLQATKR